MYVKVHEKDNQWFRDDNGALVGKTLIKAGDKTGEALIVTDKNDGILASYGYLDKNHLFVPFCKRQACNYDCLCACFPHCRYTTKDSASSGHYIYVYD